MALKDVNVVLVRGACADGSSWAKIIAPLAAEGFGLVAAPLPLTSFGDGVAALDRTLERVAGPIVLAAVHSLLREAIAAVPADRAA